MSVPAPLIVDPIGDAPLVVHVDAAERLTGPVIAIVPALRFPPMLCVPPVVLLVIVSVAVPASRLPVVARTTRPVLSGFASALWSLAESVMPPFAVTGSLIVIDLPARI